MNEDINILENNIQYFFNMKTNNLKNSEFKAYFYQGDNNTNNMHVLYDNQNYIHYLLHIPKSKEYIIKEKNEYEITITDSSYDFFLYKKSPLENTINCLLVIIINDIDIKLTNENYLEFKEEKLININNQEKIINQIKKAIFNYLNNEMIKGNKDIKNILLEEKEKNFLYNKNIIESNNESIKIQIEKLSKLISKVEINTKTNNILNFDNLFMNVYEIFSPMYKSFLEEKYLNEMPINLYNLMEKYKEVKITKICYDNYKNKNKNNKLFKKSNNNSNSNNQNKNINFKIINEKIVRKKKNIFKLKKLKRRNTNKINNKKINFEIQKKKDYFRINKVKSENKEEIKKRNESLNKMNIEEDENKNKFKKIKNLFKCVSALKKKENFFVVKK